MALRGIVGAVLVWAALASPSTGADLLLTKDAAAQTDDALDVELKSFLMSDYIYRGVSLSQRKPSAGASIDAEWHGLYVGTNVQSVDLSTQPASEVTLSGGYRWSMAGFELDLGVDYFWYPGEILTDNQPATSYWELDLDIERRITEQLKLTGVLGYAPNISGTRAWGAYAEAGFELKLGTVVPDVTSKLHAAAGYWRFGNTSPTVGAVPLPAYANWQAGLEFTFKNHFVFDLSYVDTNLSKEDCFIATGDRMATSDGVANLVGNPAGLRSRLCGATVIATMTVRFDLRK